MFHRWVILPLIPEKNVMQWSETQTEHPIVTCWVVVGGTGDSGKREGAGPHLKNYDVFIPGRG